MLLAGCGSHDNDAVRVATIGDPASPFATGARLPAAAQLARAATTEGLVALDPEGRVIPGLADRWIVTDGGLAYIFRLRDASWPDGTPINGESAAVALHQALGEIEGTPLALDLAGISDIRAMAGRVVEIRLTRATPDFLQLLAQPELGLARSGKGWGPMVLKREGDTAVFSPLPPERREAASADPAGQGHRALRLVAMPGEQALAAFAKGDVDVVLGGTFVDLPRAARTTLGKSTARFDPVIGLFGLVVTRADGLLATPSGREAIAMVIDRDSLAAGFAATGWVPSTRIVSAGTDGDPGLVGERWTDIDIDGRRTLAARRIGQWIAASHSPPVLRIALPQGPGADILFDRLSSDFQEVGITAIRARPGEPADLRLIDTVARYPRAAWFLNQLGCAALHGPCSPAADALADRARAVPDAAGAALLWAEAERALTASNIYIPLGPPIRWSLERGEDAGFSPNRWGFHSLAALADATD